MKRSQNGSAGTVILFLVIVALIYWQWDWISGLFGSKLHMGRAVAELVDYRCERQSDGRMRIDGTVRNISDSPIELRAVTAIYDSSGKKSDYSEATIRPVPLKPGQVGDFRGDAPPLPDAGSCRLDGLVDSTTGKPIGYSGGRR
ncbi:MAG: hypothetical protein QOD50_611 [Actinomycetota bacterium]|nr:hypothetical protein [Actinomycetota bacterium]